MITFKEGWSKLYYTQHTLLSNVGQLPILFLRNKPTQGREIMIIINNCIYYDFFFWHIELYNLPFKGIHDKKNILIIKGLNIN